MVEGVLRRRDCRGAHRVDDPDVSWLVAFDRGRDDLDPAVHPDVIGWRCTFLADAEHHDPRRRARKWHSD